MDRSTCCCTLNRHTQPKYGIQSATRTQSNLPAPSGSWKTQDPNDMPNVVVPRGVPRHVLSARFVSFHSGNIGVLWVSALECDSLPSQSLPAFIPQCDMRPAGGVNGVPPAAVVTECVQCVPCPLQLRVCCNAIRSARLTPLSLASDELNNQRPEMRGRIPPASQRSQRADQPNPARERLAAGCLTLVNL